MKTRTCHSVILLCGLFVALLVSQAFAIVELNSFEAIPGDGFIVLQWATASEFENDRFEINRDGVLVTEIPGQGNTATGHDYAWTDQPLVNGNPHSYLLVSVDLNGEREELGEVSATPLSVPGPPVALPESPSLGAYPNPFNASTTISFVLPRSSHVRLDVFDVTGRAVATVADEVMNAGEHRVGFDASAVSGGLYFYRMQAAGVTQTRKFVVLK